MCAVASAPGVPGAASVRVQHVMSRLTGGRDAATTRGARSCWLCADDLACLHCGGRLRLIATLHDPAVIRKLLAHLGMAPSGPSPGPAPPVP